MKSLNENPYWEVFKYAFVIAGGAGLAGGLVAGGYKIAKKGMKVFTREAENEENPVVEKVQEVGDIAIVDEDD